MSCESQLGGLSGETNLARSEPKKQCPSAAEGAVAPSQGPGWAESIEACFRVGQDPSRDRGPDRCDVLRWDRGGARDQRWAGSLQASPSVARVGPDSEYRLQHPLRGWPARGSQPFAQRRALHGSSGREDDPESDGGGRLHTALHQRRRAQADGRLQCGASSTLAGSGPGAAGSGGVSGPHCTA